MRPAIRRASSRRSCGGSSASTTRESPPTAANPVWPRRVEAAPTIVRELESEGDPHGPGSLEALADVEQPVLQLLGGESVAAFRVATEALDARLADGRIATIAGARHAAHHTHPDTVVRLITAFAEER